MKISKIKLGKTEYPMTLSMTAVEGIIEAFGGMDQMAESMDSEDIGIQLRTINSLIKILVDAGIRYSKAMDIDCPDALDFDPSDVLDLSDPNIVTAIKEAMTNDQKTTVKTRPPKNSKNVQATQGE